MKKEFDIEDWVSDCCGAKIVSEAGIGDFRDDERDGIGQTHCFVCSHCKKCCNIKQFHDIQPLRLKKK